MNSLEIMRTNRGTVSGVSSAKHSSFSQGSRLARKAFNASLAHRAARMSLAPVAVAEVSAEANAIEQRGK